VLGGRIIRTVCRKSPGGPCFSTGRVEGGSLKEAVEAVAFRLMRSLALGRWRRGVREGENRRSRARGWDYLGSNHTFTFMWRGRGWGRPLGEDCLRLASEKGWTWHKVEEEGKLWEMVFYCELSGGGRSRVCRWGRMREGISFEGSSHRITPLSGGTVRKGRTGEGLGK